MHIEIERKFIVKSSKLPVTTSGEHIKQGYLLIGEDKIVRIRMAEEKAYLTVKFFISSLSRKEFEYEIPFKDAVELLKVCIKPIISKIRYKLEVKGQLWEVDKFLEENEGLVVAEAELLSEKDILELPPWVWKEVTGDSRFFNANLVKFPFKNWPDKKKFIVDED